MMIPGRIFYFIRIHSCETKSVPREARESVCFSFEIWIFFLVCVIINENRGQIFALTSMKET